MGTVWRAEDSLLDRQVALKQLRVSPYLDEDELATLYERTRREARSAARINHPNVVVVHDVVEDRGLPCIVMEYVPSTTLGDVLKDGTVTPEEAARIGRGMIAALRAAHAAGVLHRDVKPGNVLLGDDGRVVLTDFGIARSTGTSTLTKTGEMVGSIDYIAPERVKGAKPGPASDLWALGATLYQALEGRPPFRKDTAVETAYAIAIDPLEPPRNAGPLAKLIETLLAKEPELRPPAELVEQILREPAAEPETAYMRVPEPLAAPGREEQDPPRTRREAVPETGPEATVVDSSAGTGGGDGGRKRKALLWSAVALVAVAGAGIGLFFSLQGGGGADEDTVARSAPGKDTASEGSGTRPTPAASAPPSAPAGYRMVEEKKLDASFPVPNGWTREEKPSTEVNYVDRTGRAALKVNALPLAGADPLQHWKDVEVQTRTQVGGYRLDRMHETRFQGERAAYWEFTFEGRARRYRAADLGFGKEGGKEYAIYLSAPAADWDRYRPVFDAACDGFRAKH
ncbi:protein kinase domain-containing protein [Streptomyces sp. NPDC002537]